jgi:dolichol-phosphate mannosyltransferase
MECDSNLGRHRTPDRLSLVVPAFNEEAVIARSVQEAIDALAQFANEFEVIVVDDGSTDRTAGIVGQLAVIDARIRLVRQRGNLGYGAALRAGFAASRYELVAFTDADGQFDLADLDYMLPLARQYDIVSGYRIDRQDSGLRKFCSWGYNTLNQLLLGATTRDIDCALKVFHREQVLALAPRSNRFFANTEMAFCARRIGLKTVEVGVQHRPRAAGTSKVSWKDVPRTLSELVPFWWREVMFSRHTEGMVGETQSLPKFWGALGLLLIVASLLLFPRLSFPLIEPDEGRYAEIPREMLMTGEWVVPQFHGEPYLDKPPLFYWLCALSYRVFGVHDWAARLVPALSGLITIAVTYCFGARMLGRQVAMLGTTVLTLSLGFLYCSRFLVLDSLFTLLVTVSWLAAYQALAGPRWDWRWWMLSAVACGMGVLTKGPVALVLVVPPLVAVAWLHEHADRLTRVRWMAFAAAVFATAAPWYVMLITHEPEFVRHFFWDHNVNRFFTNAHHPRPIWYFLPVAFLGMMPWGLLLFPLFGFLFRRSESARGDRPPALGYLLLAVGWCLLFFSASRGKLAPYILPAAPATSLMLGWFIDRTCSPFATAPELVDRSIRLFRLGTFLVCVGGCAIGPLAVALGLMDWSVGLSQSGVWSLAIAAGVLFVPRTSSRLTWSAFCVAAFAVAVVSAQGLFPSWAGDHQVATENSRRNRELTNPQIPVAIIEGRWGSVPFYLHRDDITLIPHLSDSNVVEFCDGAEVTMVFLNHNYAVDDLRAALPAEFQCDVVGQSVLTTIVRVSHAELAPPGDAERHVAFPSLPDQAVRQAYFEEQDDLISQ